ncbi:MAG: substrate-binding domain-containing protein [Pseudomonadota bacterium]
MAPDATRARSPVRGKPALKPLPRPGRVTINDVADAAGLSKGTVSRALNGYSDIAAGTQLRVKRLADRLGYRPLAQAQAIRTGRVRALALILNTGNADMHRPFLADFLDGISRAASDENWTLTVATADGLQDETATMARLIDERKADGFILPRALWRDPRVELCLEREVPFILYGRTRDTEGCAWFDIAGEAAIEAAVTRLAEAGHKDIGFLNGSREYTFAHLRYAAFTDATAACGFTPNPAWIREGVTDEASGAELGAEILAEQGGPSAVVCALDVAAIGLYDAARRAGRRIGHDLAVISYDGLPQGAALTPPLTTYSVDNRLAGKSLASLLIRRVRGEPVEDLRELAQATLIARASDLAPATGGATERSALTQKQTQKRSLGGL